VAGKPDWVPPGVDIWRANSARVYDYLLGGRHNFRPDQDAGRALVAIDPGRRTFARADRAFLGRAVRGLSSDCGQVGERGGIAGHVGGRVRPPQGHVDQPGVHAE
jgi:S-adenosyl methyltransferase